MSDEIHCDLLLDAAASHAPTATLHPELPSVSLFSPNKAYNIPGLSLAVAVVADPALRDAFEDAQSGLVSGVSPLAFAAALWAYTERSDWLAAVTGYLAQNRDLLEDAVGGIGRHRNDPCRGHLFSAGSDVSALGLENPNAHFERFGIGLSDGEQFGAPGFQRFNFGCPRVTLEQGLSRLAEAVRNA